MLECQLRPCRSLLSVENRNKAAYWPYYNTRSTMHGRWVGSTASVHSHPPSSVHSHPPYPPHPLISSIVKSEIHHGHGRPDGERSFQFRLVNRNSILHIEIRTYNLIKTCELFIKTFDFSHVCFVPSACFLNIPRSMCCVGKPQRGK